MSSNNFEHELKGLRPQRDGSIGARARLRRARAEAWREAKDGAYELEGPRTVAGVARDPTDVRRRRRALRARLFRRALRLSLVPVDARCPSCGEVKVHARWSRYGVCLACYRRARMESRVVELRLEIDGRQLRRERRRIGLSQAEFAARAGWSQSYQSRLESGTRVVAEATVHVIKRLLVSHISGP